MPGEDLQSPPAAQPGYNAAPPGYGAAPAGYPQNGNGNGNGGFGGQPGYPQAGAYQQQAPQPFYPSAAPPKRKMRTSTIIRLVILAVVLIGGGISWAARQHAASVGGQTSDGVIVAGDCVNVDQVAGTVARVDCTNSHTGKVSTVLPVGSAPTSCPAGQLGIQLQNPDTHADVGTACVDTTDHS